MERRVVAPFKEVSFLSVKTEECHKLYFRLFDLFLDNMFFGVKFGSMMTIHKIYFRLIYM